MRIDSGIVRLRARPVALFWRAVVVALAFMGLSGCGTVGYYWQAASGHLEIMRRSKPVAEWIAAPETREAVRVRLQLSQRIRDFAVTELKLPENTSYRSYADLQRPYVVWNVVAAPVDSLSLKTWCFAIVGCLSYRGYFSEADARAQAQELAAAGWEVHLYGVPAYSTLGWLNALGGDPLLNTFLFHHEGDLARLVFHELAHQVVYVPDDTAFNESFATAVERMGVRRWLQSHTDPKTRAAYEAHEVRRQQFRSLTRQTRAELAALFEARSSDVLDGKQVIMARFRDRYAALREQWGGYSGYDQWVAQANNASLAGQGTYEDGVPAFEALHRQLQGDWNRFYDAVRVLGARPASERRRFLKEP